MGRRTSDVGEAWWLTRSAPCGVFSQEPASAIALIFVPPSAGILVRGEGAEAGGEPFYRRDLPELPFLEAPQALSGAAVWGDGPGRPGAPNQENGGVLCADIK